MTPRDERLDDLLRAVLPAGLPEGPLDPDLDLLNAGLTSMAIMELLVRIEDTYGQPMPDHLLRPGTFATPATVWEAVLTSGAAPG
ncbi:acyl carrier protein [Streptomyces sp. NPDC046870]|uniref:acyl carrier protein n=1 Tax=Streptomyces sp. NPDC046870 TaxID=3155135 RepID=UPI0034521227